MATRGDLEAVLAAALPRMLAAATRILRDEAEAKDAAKDACLLAFRKLDTYDGSGTLAAWLYRIGINAALARLCK